MIKTWTSTQCRRRRTSRNTKNMPLTRKEDSSRTSSSTIGSMTARATSSTTSPIIITKAPCYHKLIRGGCWMRRSRWSWKTNGERSVLHNMPLKDLFGGKRDWVAKILKTSRANYGSSLKMLLLGCCKSDSILLWVCKMAFFTSRRQKSITLRDTHNRHPSM
jgi:hypothetical protein